MKRILLTGAALVLAGGMAWAGGHGQGQGMMNGGFFNRMAQIDAHDDGVISDDEAAAEVESVFLAMDADDDGERTEEEYMPVRLGPGQGLNAERQKQMQERKRSRFAPMDTDKNGKVSKAEFIAAGKARFAAADSDGDGKITPWEFRAQHWR